MTSTTETDPVEEFEDSILLLAGERKVRTPEGSQFYGLPIGATITADLIAAKKAINSAKGISEPKGALSPSGNGTASTNKAGAPGVGIGKPGAGPVVKKPTLAGPAKFKVGETEFSAPAGSKVIRPKNSASVAYVRTPDGSIHAFSDSGEVEVPSSLMPVLASKFTADFETDAHYDVEVVGAVEGVENLQSAAKDAPVGTLAQSGDGALSFKKTADGEWSDDTFGLTLLDDDVQKMLDSGTVALSENTDPTAPGAKPFAGMSPDEAEAAMDEMPVGSVLSFGELSPDILAVKQKDGTWKSSKTGNALESKNLTSLLDYLTIPSEEDKKKYLGSGNDEEATPDAPSADRAVPSPASAPEGDALAAPAEQPSVDQPSTIAEDSAPTYPTKPDDAKSITKDQAKQMPLGTDAWISSGEWQFYAKKTSSTGWDVTDLSNDQGVGQYETDNLIVWDSDDQVFVSPSSLKEIEPEASVDATEDAPKIPDPSPEKPKAVKAVKSVKAPDAPAAPAKQKAVKSTGKGYLKAGQEIDYADLSKIPYGGSFTYTTQFGVKAVYTKVDDTHWMSPNGNIFEDNNSLSHMKGLVYNGDPEVPDVSFVDYAKDDKIKKYGHLREMAVGTQIVAQDEGDVLTKGEDGWLDETGQKVSPSFLADKIVAGKLEMWDAASVEEPDDTPTIQLFPGGTAYSKAQISEAVDAMEAHTGFQIAYGLKSLPDDHPLKDKAVQDAIKAESALDYPDLKPKPAFVAYLKAKAGITDAPKEKDEAPSTQGPKIHLGSDDPKAKTIQGFDGGDFTPQEVEEAIAILEAFGGKAFKAELNKKNNALGVLNPNDLVGFNKDKTVTKQKFLDLLKDSLAKHKEAHPDAPEPEKIPAAEPAKSLSTKEMADLPPGAEVIDFGGSGLTWTKGSDGLWTYADMSYDVEVPLNDSELMEAASPITLKSVPGPDNSNIPDYAKIPAAVQSKIATPDPEKHPLAGMNVADTEQGDQLIRADGVVFTRAIYGWETSEGEAYSQIYVQNLLNSGEFVEFKKHDPKSKDKKDSGWDGKDVFHAPYGAVVVDPTGHEFEHQTEDVWIDKTNNTPLSDTQIQSGLNSGYLTVKKDQDSVPSLNVNAPETNPSGLTPGKYSSPKGKAYMVVHSDGTGTYVNASGDVTSITVAKVKANHKAGMTKYHGVVPDSEVPKADPSAPKVGPAPKKVKAGPVVMPEGTFYLGSPNKSGTTVYVVEGETVKIYKGGEVWSSSQTTPFNADDPTVEAVPLSKIKTAYFQGKIVDINGDSVVPEGHSGPVIMAKIPTTTQSLVEIRKAMEAGEFDDIFKSGVVAKFQKMGLPLDSYKLRDFARSSPDFDADKAGPLYQAPGHPENMWSAEAKKMLSAKIDKMLEGADTSIPEANTSALFDWGQNGEAFMPEGATVPYSSYDAKSLTTKAKAISAAIGGGKILIPPTSKYDKQSWIQAFESGDFALMYQYEVNSLSAKGKSHPSGYLHPGYSGNEATNKITWGAAVKGEVPAGSEVPGSWSDVSINSWSLAEVDNYLIAAKMAHPEYLTPQEKRTWVSWHKHGKQYKTEVDGLSVKAKNRKEAGAAPSSPAPVWTDDIVPAQPWDHLFDGGAVPDWSAWSNNTNQDTRKKWAKAHLDDPEFVALFDAALKEHYEPASADLPEDVKAWTWDTRYALDQAMQQYWTKKHDAYIDFINTPVYSKVSLITGDEAGSHDVWITKDQFDRKYVFKPTPPDRIFRAEIEKASADLSGYWGFGTPKSKIAEIDGEVGILMDFVDHVSSFKGKGGNAIQMADLTDKQVGQVAAEHVLDWILDNDDTHSSNLLIGASGNIVGIDKGRGFFVYGNWNGLAADSKAHSNAQIIYTRLYDDIRSGKVSKEQAQAAYLAAIKAAKRIQKSDDAYIEAKIREGVQNRKKWSPPDYMTHFSHEQAPQGPDDLVAAVLARKNAMVEQIDEMWDRIFSASPYEKPEIPPKAFAEGHYSGWDEDGFVEHAVEAKAWGVTGLHASSSVKGGTSLVWTEQTADGTEQHKGTLALGNIAQQKVLGYLQTKVAPEGNDYQSSYIQGFPSTSSWKSTISAAAKDASKHVADKEYTEDVWTNLDTLADTLAKDEDHWSPDLTVAANGFVKFPSGTQVPAEGLAQYRLALTHYRRQIDAARKAKTEGLVTEKSDFTVFEVTPTKKNGMVYTGPDGETFTELYGGQGWVHVKGSSVSMKHKPSQEIIDGTAEGWSSNNEKSADTDPVIYSLTSASDEQASLSPDGTKVLSGSKLSAGHDGQQYEMVLPTGEKIVFRNGGTTGTIKTQQGRITFTLAGDSPQASLARVQQHLATIGLPMDGAQEEHAETIYWRSMFDRVIHSTNGDAKVKKARSTLMQMSADLKKKIPDYKGSIDKFEIVEAIGLTMTPEEEQKFWHDLAVDVWGEQKVTQWIAQENHLPVYSHMNLANPELTTGRAKFKRIDVDVDEVKKTGSLLAIGNSGKDKSLDAYITSGGMLSTEERLRLLGTFKKGASSGEDQATGGANSVFTRIAVPGKNVEKTGAIYGQHVAYWSPEVMQLTSTYSFSSDQYGKIDNMSGNNPFDPMYSLKNHDGESNETMVQDTLSILDHLEIMIFEDAANRNAAIQRLKALGIEKLRGLSIEDRLIMRTELNQTLQKVRAAWTL